MNKRDLQGILANVNDFKAVWEALAQWADNERDIDPEDMDEAHKNRLGIVEAVVERMEVLICAVAETEIKS